MKLAEFRAQQMQGYGGHTPSLSTRRFNSKMAIVLDREGTHPWRQSSSAWWLSESSVKPHPLANDRNYVPSYPPRYEEYLKSTV